MLDFKKYLAWRPLMSADDFFTALLKLVPYEVLSAYGIIRTGYATMPGSTGASLLFFDLALTIACFFLYYNGTKSTVISALSLSLCFLLIVMSIDADTFSHLADDYFYDMPMWFRVFFQNSTNRFYLLGAAVLVCLSSSTLRSVLGKK